MNDDTAKPSQAEGEDPGRPGTGDAPQTTGHPSQAEGEDPDPDPDSVDGPEGKGAPSAEYDVSVSDHDGVTRVDIADDAVARPGPGQPEADED